MISRRVLIYGCVVSAFVIVLAMPRGSFISSACPVVLPQPLRMLYRNSDLIVVARIGKTRVAQRDSNQLLLETELTVSSIHKGDVSKPVIHLYHWGSANSDPQLESEYKAGDTLLLFLAGREGGTGYQVFDSRYGAKHLSAADLQVYLDRIGELTAIMRQGKPNDEEVVEWLVRCVEDPATRWEGAFELGMSRYALESQEESEATDGDQEEDGEVAEDEEQADGSEEVEEEAEGEDVEQVTDADDSEELSETPADTEDEDADPIFILLLTDVQRQRLATALFSTPVFTENELFLVLVVEAIHDPRLAEFLLKQLSGMADNPPSEADFIVSVLGRIADDRSLARLAEKYSKRVTSYDSLVAGDEPGGQDDNALPAVNVRAEMVKQFLSVAKRRVVDRGSALK